MQGSRMFSWVEQSEMDGSIHTSRQAWQALLTRLSLEDKTGTYRQLVNAYTGNDRHYHSLTHIADCLTQLSENRELAERPDEVALALWFHDAVYNWRSSTNEADSAEWAGRFLSQQDGDETLANRVQKLIMATCHGATMTAHLDRDEALIGDIDLSILGRDAETYNEFEAGIRREYRWVPKPIYRRKRREVLQWFLGRERIYLTDAFDKLYGAPARANLKRAIAALRS